jgi:serine/threonine protein kinase
MNVAFVVVDTPLDVRFVFWLSTRSAFTRHYYAALTVLVTTFLGNFVCVWYFLRREIRGSQRFGMWLSKSRSQIAAVLFLALFKFDCLLLICSKLRGWRSLSAPLSERSVHLITLLGLAGTLLEGIPQLAIFAAVATSNHHHLDFLTTVNLLVCSANIVYQLLNRLLAHLLVDSAGLVVERIHHRGQDNAAMNAKSAEQSCSQAVQSYQISPGDIHLTDEVLGEGSEAVVRRGRFKGVDIACKLLNARSQWAVAKGLEQVEILATVHHPHVVRLFGVAVVRSQVNTTIMIVMDLMHKSLKDFIYEKHAKEQKGYPEQVVRILAGIARGMAHLHENRIVHRDLKPGNVMLDKRMIAKIVDFGTSRLMMPDSNGDAETSMTANIGTPGYNAPEVISADELQQYSPKVDVFSFGVLAWACITCEHPFASQHGRCWDIQADILDGKRPPITAAFDDFPSHLRSLTESCWHGIASKRPPFTQIEIRLMCGHRQAVEEEAAGDMEVRRAAEAAAAAAKQTEWDEDGGFALNTPPYLNLRLHLNHLAAIPHRISRGPAGHRGEQAADCKQADEQLGTDHSSQVDDAAAPKSSEHSAAGAAGGSRRQYPTFDPAEDVS